MRSDTEEKLTNLAANAAANFARGAVRFLSQFHETLTAENSASGNQPKAARQTQERRAHNPASGEWERMLTVAEAAEFLNISERTVYERASRAQENGFPVRRVGDELRFLASELLAWTEKQAATHKSATKDEKKLTQRKLSVVKYSRSCLAAATNRDKEQHHGSS